MKFSVYWSTNNLGGNIENCSWDNIFEKLKSIKNKSGSLGISVLDGPDVGVQNLDMRADGNLYLVTLGEDDGNDYIVRSYFDPIRIEEMIDILGDKYDARSLISDFDLIIRIFKEFFCTGDVSHEILR